MSVEEDLRYMKREFARIHLSGDRGIIAAWNSRCDTDRNWWKYQSPIRLELVKAIGGTIVFYKYLRILDKYHTPLPQVKRLFRLQSDYLTEQIKIHKTIKAYVEKNSEEDGIYQLISKVVGDDHSAHSSQVVFDKVIVDLFKNRVEFILKLHKEGALPRKEGNENTKAKNRGSPEIWSYPVVRGCKTLIWSPPRDA